MDEGGHAALARRAGRRQHAAPVAQLGLFAAPVDPRLEGIRRELEALDVDGMRPLDALNLLAEWKKRVG